MGSPAFQTPTYRTVLRGGEARNGAPRWTVALDLPRERLERLFLLLLLNGANFDSMSDAASAVPDAVARDGALEATRH